MNRRNFFKRTAGAVVGAAVAAPIVAEVAARPSAPTDYGLFFEFNQSDLQRMVRALAESSRYHQERLAAEMFNAYGITR